VGSKRGMDTLTVLGNKENTTKDRCRQNEWNSEPTIPRTLKKQLRETRPKSECKRPFELNLVIHLS